MNGVKMKDCKFYVDKEHRTVVCVIPRTRFLFSKFIEDHFRWRDIDIWYAVDDINLNMPSSFMGKAVCSREDEWDEETGRMIAFSRAKDKCYKSFFKRANHLVRALDTRLGDMVTMFNDFGLKLENRREAMQTKINERIGVE